VDGPPEDRFRVLFNLAAVGLVISTQDGAVLEANEAAVRMYGVPRAELLAPGFRIASLWADPSKRQAFIDTLRREGSVREYPVDIRSRDGAVHETLCSVDLVEFEGQKVLVSSFRDVTAQRQAERAAQRLRERFARIFEASPVGILLTQPDGRFADVNPAFLAMTGYTRDEVLAPDFTAYQVWKVAAERDRALHRLREGERVRDLRTRLTRKDGSSLEAEVSMDLVDVGGQTTVLSVVSDLGDRLQAEQERELRLASVAEAERMRRLEQFSSDFVNRTAHEFGTPLTPMLLDVQALARLDLPPKAQRPLASLDRNLRRLEALVGATVSAAKLQTGRLRLDRAAVDLERLVADTVAEHQSEFRRRGLALTADAQPVRADVDASRLRLVLGHLLGNAGKFTPSGGAVRVRLRHDGEVARVEVEDTGVGLTAEQIARLWRPYAQVHDAMQQTEAGVGLGLYVTRNLVALHGGEMGVHSDGPGTGSTFWFTLPLRPTAGKASRAAGPTPKGL